MIPVILNYLIDFWFGIFSKISGFILKPIIDYLVSINFFDENYLAIFQNFLNNYFYNYIKFARDVIINITGIPTEFFLILGMLLSFMFGLFIMSFTLKYVFNAYCLLRHGKSAYSFGRKL